MYSRCCQLPVCVDIFQCRLYQGHQIGGRNVQGPYVSRGQQRYYNECLWIWGGAQRMPVLCPWPGLYWLTLLLSEQASHHSVCILVILVAETKSLLLVKYLHFSSYRYILKVIVIAYNTSGTRQSFNIVQFMTKDKLVRLTCKSWYLLCMFSQSPVLF